MYKQNVDTSINLKPMAETERVAFTVYSGNISTSKNVLNCRSIFTTELEVINYSVSLTDENVLLATDFKSLIQAIRPKQQNSPENTKTIRKSSKTFTLCRV